MLRWYAGQFGFFSVLNVNLTVDDGVGHKRHCDGELVGWKRKQLKTVTVQPRDVAVARIFHSYFNRQDITFLFEVSFRNVVSIDVADNIL